MRVFIIIIVIFVCVINAGRTRAQKEVYQASDPEPTAEEVLAVEYLNRLRSNPQADAERILASYIKNPRLFHVKFDQAMFTEEMKRIKAVEPVVINLQLLQTAREHTHYLILNNVTTHDQEKGRPGFTGATLEIRLKRSGYRFGLGENCYRATLGNWHAHMGFVIDIGAGPGGMQPGRGHRMLMVHREAKEVGIAVMNKKASRWGGNTAVVHHFGRANGERFAGGVVYIDKNENGFYDIDEGLGGVEIVSSTGQRVKTWKAGAWSMKLNSKRAVSFTAVLNGETFSGAFNAGRQNIKFDVVISKSKQREKVLALISEIEFEEEEKLRVLKIMQLIEMGEQVELDAENAARYEKLTGKVVKQRAEMRSKVIGLLSNTNGKYVTKRREIQMLAKSWEGTVEEDWYREAEALALALSQIERVKERYQNVEKPSKRFTEKSQAQLETLKKMISVKITDPGLQKRLNDAAQLD